MATTTTTTPYERAVTGFQNYWYPACGEREFGRRPKRMVLLGEPIALVRRGKRIYAVQDECPHRGARMSLGKDEFPGTDTLSCRFHGWTFDLTDGRCVAALTDGPDSPVVGKVRIRTFPVEQRKGIVWVWIGRGAPVPLEEDAPALLLEDATVVKFRHRQVYGNWRYHVEGAGGGHFQMLHRDAIGMLFNRFYSYQPDYVIETGDGSGNGDDHGPWLSEKTAFPVPQSDFPDVGTWPPMRPWRRLGQPFHRLVRGVQSVTSIRLPGYLRVYHFPMNDAMYYEWYVAIDADHYNYFQVSCHWPKNPISRLWTHLWWYAFAGPIRMGRFNDQDKGMVAANTDWEKRQGPHGPVPEHYRPDRYPAGWIEYANANARSAGPR
jgi:phenylpropionate dioxygenase-like ring-hydroxylating dioxygenase large terminal subunit